MQQRANQQLAALNAQNVAERNARAIARAARQAAAAGQAPGII